MVPSFQDLIGELCLLFATKLREMPKLRLTFISMMLPATIGYIWFTMSVTFNRLPISTDVQMGLLLAIVVLFPLVCIAGRCALFALLPPATAKRLIEAQTRKRIEAARQEQQTIKQRSHLTVEDRARLCFSLITEAHEQSRAQAARWFIYGRVLIGVNTLAFLVGLYVILVGDSIPGGAFIAGVSAVSQASALGLLILGRKEEKDPTAVMRMVAEMQRTFLVIELTENLPDQERVRQRLAIIESLLLAQSRESLAERPATLSKTDGDEFTM